MITEEWSNPDEIFSSDSCLTGCGGFWNGNYFHTEFPHELQIKKYHINILEMLSVIVCLRLWGSFYKGKRIRIYCDNSAVCCVINSGRAKCEELQSCLRELAYLAALNECEVRAVHLGTNENRLSDHLSRWHLNKYHMQQFFVLTAGCDLIEYKVHEHLFDFISIW